MKKTKRFLSVFLLMLLVIGLATFSASADRSEAISSDMEAVSNDKNLLISEKFPQIDNSIVNTLTEEQKDMLLAGEYFTVEIGGTMHYFNPDNNPSSPTPEEIEKDIEERARIDKLAHKFSDKRSAVTLISPEDREAEIERRFGGEIPDILPEEELDYVLSGGYLKIETPNHNYYFNPDNDPDAPPATKSDVTYWDVDMGKSGTWYPDTTKLEYKVGGLFSDVNTYIHYDVPRGADRHGRVWTQILGTSGKTNQSQNEATQWQDGRVRAVTTTSVKGDNTATRAYFAYRDLKTNWSRRIEIY